MKKTRFPAGFTWGTATASYQVEGAKDEDGKGESIWDRFSHIPGKVMNGDTGDVACDQYHRFKDDVKLMKSWAWTRTGSRSPWRACSQGKGQVNQKGLDYYNRLVDELLANGTAVSDAVSLGPPQALEDEWLGKPRDRGALHYVCGDGDEVAGDRVKDWMVFNEPWVFTFLGYVAGVLARHPRPCPGDADDAHRQPDADVRRRAMRAIGTADSIGTAFSMSGIYAYTDSAEDRAAAERQWGFSNDWFLRPIMKGEYPAAYMDMEATLAEADVRPGEVGGLKEPLDFIGVNLYSRIIAANNPDEKYLGVRSAGPRPRSHFGWEVWPAAIYRTLMRVHRDYEADLRHRERLLVAGRMTPTAVHDATAWTATRVHRQVRAIDEGADVRGTTPGRCSTTSSGRRLQPALRLTYVDFENGQKRIVKDSGYWYRDLVKAGQIEYDEALV
jgi:beta-glucosidase